MLTDIHIRPFAARDQQATRMLILTGLGEHFGWIDETLNPDLDDIAASYLVAGHLFVVAECYNALVGTAALALYDDAYVGQRGQMVRVSVAATARRAGIGQALVAYLLQAAREHSIARIIVETNASWHDAIGLYQSCGFAIYERRDNLVFLIRELAEQREPPVKIRQLTEDDAAVYWELRLRALREEPEAFGADYEESAQRPLSTAAERLRDSTPEHFLLGAFADDVLVGIVAFSREEYKKVRHKGSVYQMYVAPEVRGQHIGRALMNALIARARTCEGVEQINLSVVTSNTAARSLYLSLGFVIYGLEQHALKLGEAAYVDEEHMALMLK